MGPVRPKPEIEQTINFGFTACSFSGSRPSLAALAARKFSTTTSQRRSRLQRISSPFRIRKIECNRLFVAVARKVIGAQIAQERRTPHSRFVAAFGVFDLDDFRAEVAQDLATKRPRQNARRIEDSNSRQRPATVDFHSKSFPRFALKFDTVIL